MVNELPIRSFLKFLDMICFKSNKLSFGNEKIIYVIALKFDYFAKSQYCRALNYEKINLL